jgi:hypothetical protein
LDQVCAEFAQDPAFASKLPTREQIARAWAMARYQQAESSKSPAHAAVVAALRKMYLEFKINKSAANPRSSH